MNYMRNIFSTAGVRVPGTLYINTVPKTITKSTALQSATKYHLILSMHLIAQLFLIFIYLFTSLVSCLITNIIPPTVHAMLDEI